MQVSIFKMLRGFKLKLMLRYQSQLQEYDNFLLSGFTLLIFTKVFSHLTFNVIALGNRCSYFYC